MGKQYRVVTLDGDFDFLQLARTASRERRHTALLYSPQDNDPTHSEDTACWRLLGFDPILTFKSKGAFCEFSYENVTTRVFGNPWTIFESRFSQFEVLGGEEYDFPLGAAIGYFGYDMKNSVEPGLPQNARDDLESYDCFVGFYTTLFVQKKLKNGRTLTKIVASGHDAHGNCHSTRADANLEKAYSFISDIQKRDKDDCFSQPSEKSNPEKLETTLISRKSMKSSLTENGFINCVQKAKGWIKHGHIYQVNLSQRLSVEIGDIGFDGLDFFSKLLFQSSANLGGYIQADAMELMSCSPELFLSMKANRVMTSPIKGTRPRSSDPIQDQSNLDELMRSEKEKAELTMITDLLRNDIGKISKYGSVSVDQFLKHKALSHVHHMFSTITGSIKNNVSHLGVLRSCFPGGSITGAPKVRAMEIIDELEPVTRGPYTGSLGFLGFNQISQFNILIRSAHLSSGNLFYSVGAGIVADSDPLMEYQETWYKAKDFKKALDEKKILGADFQK